MIAILSSENKLRDMFFSVNRICSGSLPGAYKEAQPSPECAPPYHRWKQVRKEDKTSEKAREACQKRGEGAGGVRGERRGRGKQEKEVKSGKSVILPHS